MYCGHAHLRVCVYVCVSVCLSAAACPHYWTDPDVTWGSGRGCPLVVHYWADLQSVHGLRYYGNITRTRHVSKYMLVLALCLVFCCSCFPYFYLRQGDYVFVVVCLSVSLLATLRKNFQTDLHEILREGWQWDSEQMFKFWWRSGSPSGYRDCFPDLSLLGDKESGINRLRCATLQCRASTSRHRHSSYDVITSPAHLAEVCNVPLLLVFTAFLFRAVD